MRMDIRAGTYLLEGYNPKGERMSFTRIKEALLSSILLDSTTFVLKTAYITIARTLFNGQKQSL